MLCGCTSTLIRSGGMPKSQRASITSSPLFMSVAESIVIFLPMLQFGCFSAWARVTRAMSCLRKVPERTARSGQDKVPDIAVLRRPAGTGKWRCARCPREEACTPRVRHSAMTSSPAVTSTSLLASAISLPARIAAMVGTSPAVPTMAETVMSRFVRGRHLDQPFDARTGCGLSDRRSAFSGSAAAAGLRTETISGLNWRTCFSSSSMLLPAASATTRNRSGNFSTTESVDCPMEPVEPKMEIFFTLYRLS